MLRVPRPSTSAALVAAGLLVLAGCGEPPQSKALADVVRGEQTARLNVDDFPVSYRHDGNAAVILQPMLDRVAASFARYDSEPLLTRRVAEEQQGLRQVLDARGGGRIGGVADLTMSDVQVSGHEARAHARVTVWFKSAQFWQQDPRTFPSATNILDLDLQFVEVNGRWTIDREAEAFAPGGGP